MADIVIASDSTYVIDDVEASLGATHLLRSVRRGLDVIAAVEARTPDLVVLDLQIGNMGAMAVSIQLHNEEQAGRLNEVKTLLLLDREADVFLARRCHADGWLIKPVDPMRLSAGVAAVLDGTGVFDGAPDLAPADDGAAVDDDEASAEAADDGDDDRAEVGADSGA